MCTRVITAKSFAGELCALARQCIPRRRVSGRAAAASGSTRAREPRAGDGQAALRGRGRLTVGRGHTAQGAAGAARAKRIPE